MTGGQPWFRENVVIEQENHVAVGVGNSGGSRVHLAAVLDELRLQLWVRVTDLVQELEGSITASVHDHDDFEDPRVLQERLENPLESVGAVIGWDDN